MESTTKLTELERDLLRMGGQKRAYMGVQTTIRDCKVIILPIPYDSTTSYGVGTRFGPAAIIEASTQLEFYDVELEMNTFDKIPVHTLDELGITKGDPAQMVRIVSNAVEKIIYLNKKPVIFGGEHSITPGAIAGLGQGQKGQKYDLENLSVLQIDAHTDLRNSYEGTKNSHASSMRRVFELVGGNIVQVGIRSMCNEEVEFIKEEKLEENIFYAHELNESKKNGKINQDNIKKIIERLKGKYVYVTFDIDGLDPSIVPGTGTPEPGGLSWEDALAILRAVGEKKEVVGFDIIEVSPIPPFRVSEFVAAKLAYKMMGYFWAKGAH